MKTEVKKTSIQLIKYGLIGLSNTFLTLIIIYVLVSLLSLNLYVSNVIGYIAGIINSFIWNKQWVFKSHNSKLKKELILFLVGFLICYGIQIFSVWIMMAFTPLKGISFIGIASPKFGEFVSTLIGMVVYTLCNYLYNRFITFKEVNTDGEK